MTVCFRFSLAHGVGYCKMARNIQFRAGKTVYELYARTCKSIRSVCAFCEGTLLAWQVTIHRRLAPWTFFTSREPGWISFGPKAHKGVAVLPQCKVSPLFPCVQVRHSSRSNVLASYLLVKAADPFHRSRQRARWSGHHHAAGSGHRFSMILSRLYRDS